MYPTSPLFWPFLEAKFIFLKQNNLFYSWEWKMWVADEWAFSSLGTEFPLCVNAGVSGYPVIGDTGPEMLAACSALL